MLPGFVTGIITYKTVNHLAFWQNAVASCTPPDAGHVHGKARATGYGAKPSRVIDEEKRKYETPFAVQTELWLLALEMQLSRCGFGMQSDLLLLI
jgi:hypothetical protein